MTLCKDAAYYWVPDIIWEEVRAVGRCADHTTPSLTVGHANRCSLHIIGVQGLRDVVFFSFFF